MIATRMTLRTFVDRYLMQDLPHLARKTRQKVYHTLNRWERTTRDPSVSDVTVADLYDFRRDDPEHRRDPDKPLSRVSLNSYMHAIRMILRHAQRRGLLDRIPEIPKIAEHRRLKPTPTLRDLGRMYAAAPEIAPELTWPRHMPPFRFWQSWLVVSYFTAFRLGDLMRTLTWECVRHNPDGPESIVLPARKTGSEHVIPMCDVLWRHLQILPDERSGRIFPVSKSEYLVRRELRKLAEAVGTSVPVTPHSIRRCSVTHYSMVSKLAAQIVQGCGLGVLDSYIEILGVMQDARDRLQVPDEFLQTREDNQLRLF